MPEVERIGQQVGVVRSDVEADRQRHSGIDAAGAGVQRELADGDRHAAGAEVAKAEDALVIGHHDEADVGIRAVAKQVGNAVPVVRRDPRAAGASQHVAELLAGEPHGGRVDDGQQLLQVLGEEPIEQGRIAVLERRQPDVPLQRVRLAVQPLQLEAHLLIERHDPVRQQAAQPERRPLVLGEREVLGQQPVREQGRAVELDRRRPPGGDVVVRRGKRTHRRRGYATIPRSTRDTAAMGRTNRIVTIVTVVMAVAVVGLGAYVVSQSSTTVVEDAADATIECTGWTGATDGCAAWGADVLAEGSPSNTFELEDVVRIRLDRPTFGLAEACSVDYFLSRYPDDVAWSEEIDCPDA